MVTIKGKDISPRITNSVLFRYASKKGVGVSKLITLLEDITPADLVGVFVFAANIEGTEITEQDIWDELDTRMDVFQEMANHLTEQLVPKLPEETTKKKA